MSNGNANGSSFLVALLTIVRTPLGVVAWGIMVFAFSFGANYGAMKWQLSEQQKVVEQQAQQLKKLSDSLPTKDELYIQHQAVMATLDKISEEMQRQDTLLLQQVNRANDRIDRLLQRGR